MSPEMRHQIFTTVESFPAKFSTAHPVTNVGSGGRGRCGWWLLHET